MKVAAMVMWAGLASLAACQKPTPPAPAAHRATPPFNTTLSLHDLMEHVIDPATDIVWGASGIMVDMKGEHDLSPKTPQGWAVVRDAAALVAESGNLLLLPGRVRDGKTWTGQAGRISTLGLAAMKAADEKDKDALLRIGGHLHDACEECHRVYVLGEPARP